MVVLGGQKESVDTFLACVETCKEKLGHFAIYSSHSVSEAIERLEVRFEGEGYL